MNKQQVLAIVLVIVVVAGGGFLLLKSKTPSSGTEGKLQAVASFYPMQFFTKEVGGDKVSVENITPSGAEPHDFEPSTQDIAGIQNSQLLVLNGSVEAWGDKVQTMLAGSKTKVVVAGEGLLTKQLTEEGETMSDPHIWLDPVLAKQEARKIAEGLVAVDPANADYYVQNEKALDAKFDQLDAEYRAGLANCANKDIVTSHVAFAYLAERYGLNQVAISGLSPDEEPSAAQLAEVANFARAHKVKYIFFETLVSPRLSETVANEVGAQTLVLDPIEGISDEDQAAGADYFSVMRNNLQNLRIALECKA